MPINGCASGYPWLQQSWRGGNSSPSLSDSRYPVDRFTPVLNDCPFSDYTLAGGCAWGRCEIMSLCHVPKPWAVPVRLKLLLQSGDKKAAQPPAASPASAGHWHLTFPCPDRVPRQRWAPGYPPFLICQVHVVGWKLQLLSLPCVSLLDGLVHHNPLALGCLLSVNLGCVSSAFLAGCSQRGLTVGVLKDGWGAGPFLCWQRGCAV